jgi:hypothetical protein
MIEKALISDLTWRSLEMQKAAFPGMQHYVGPDEMSVLLRPSTRREELIIHVMSLGVIAEKEDTFRTFMKEAWRRGATIRCLETGIELHPHRSMAAAVVEWRAARKNGVAKVGGKISADLREAESKKGCAAIADRWPLPSKTWPTHVLLKEANASIGKKKPIAYNTAKKIFGSRVIAQYNYQAKLKRKARRTA